MWSLLFRSWKHQDLLPFLAPSPHHGRIIKNFRFLESESEILRNKNLEDHEIKLRRGCGNHRPSPFFQRMNDLPHSELGWENKSIDFQHRAPFFSHHLPLFLLIIQLSIPSNLSLPNSSFPPPHIHFVFSPYLWPSGVWPIELCCQPRREKESKWGRNGELPKKKYQDLFLGDREGMEEIEKLRDWEIQSRRKRWKGRERFRGKDTYRPQKKEK